MTHKYWSYQPNSFTETVKLIEHYVKDEILRETQSKQLFYHNINHALAVQRRAIAIFRSIKPVLAESYSSTELCRLEGLISLCGLAHDMVQIFEPSLPQQSRKRRSGLSEQSTADQLINYIQQFNLAGAAENLEPKILICDREQQIIHDGIMATVCVPDPEASQISHSCSKCSLYQPYLYNPQPKISIVGTIIALADLGTLGMEGARAYIQDGILIFFEDNPHLYELLINYRLTDYSQTDSLRRQLLTMTNLIVDLARERQARFELEIAGLATQIRQILCNQVFFHLNPASIDQIQSIVPIQSDASLTELVDFFCANHRLQIEFSTAPS